MKNNNQVRVNTNQNYYVHASGGSALRKEMEVQSTARGRVVNMPQRQPVAVKQPKGWLQCVFLVGITVCMLVFVCTRELRVNMQAKEIRGVKEQITQQDKQRMELELQVAELEDIRIIQQQADAMGLEYPLPENTRYLVLTPAATTLPRDVGESAEQVKPWYQAILDFSLTIME